MSLQKVVEAHHAGNTGAALHYLTLYSLVYGLEAKKVFEFGSGYSSLALLEGLQESDGVLTSCDIRERDIACPFSEHKNNPNWNFIQKPSILAIEDVKNNGPYDLVFHDGDHQADVVAQDIQAIIPHMKRFGLLVLHDTHHSELGPAMIDGLSKGLGSDQNKYSIVTLPYGYGLTIVRFESDEYHNGNVQVKRKKKTSVATTISF